MRIIKNIFVLVVSIVLLIGAGLYILLMNPFVYIPEMARDLPSNIAAARSVFQNKLVNMFPLGTNESELVEALRGQRFQITRVEPEGSSGEAEQMWRAFYRYEKFPCSYVLYVQWESDKNENLRKIEADRRLICL